MKKLIVAAVALLACLAPAWAQESPAPATRSAEWKQNLGLAVNDESKVSAAIQAMPEADRAAFAAEVLGVLQTKRQHVADKAAWAKSFSATAAALVSGAGGAKKAVLAAVAAEIVDACASADAHELDAGTPPQLGALVKNVARLLKGEDRAAFANALLAVIGKAKATGARERKLALCTASLALFAGAGEAKQGVVAEVFAQVALDDLGAVAKAFSDACGQRKNNLSNEDYLQAAMLLLQAVAERTAGQPDATTRFAYAVAAFLGAASNPALLEQNLMAKLGDLLAKVGATRESFAAALAAARADLAANAELVRGLQPALGQRTPWGVIILPPGNMLAGEEGPPFVHENRPPGYQNQGIGWDQVKESRGGTSRPDRK